MKLKPQKQNSLLKSYKNEIKIFANPGLAYGRSRQLLLRILTAHKNSLHVIDERVRT